MPTALQEPVIAKKDGLLISYKQKYEKYVNESSIRMTMTAPSTVSSKTSSSFCCSKYGNQQKNEIQGGFG